MWKKWRGFRKFGDEFLELIRDDWHGFDIVQHNAIDACLIAAYRRGERWIARPAGKHEPDTCQGILIGSSAIPEVANLTIRN